MSKNAFTHHPSPITILMQETIQRIEGLIRNIENLPDPEARAGALELVRSIMDFHGAGLERIMEIIADAGEPGYAVFDNFAGDGMVGSLLLLYGLHPTDLETRVRQALDTVRPYLDSHGGNVELLGVEDGRVRLRLQGSCQSCPSSSVTLKLAIEEAIYQAAPDVVGIDAEGVAEQTSPSGLVQLGKLNGKDNAQPADGNGWEQVDGLQTLAQSSVQMFEVRGHSILFCRLGETLYAYGNNCPGCNETLEGASLEKTNLVCRTCGQHYDVMRAGRGLDQPSLHLEPFPLLVEQGQARVALPLSVTN